MANFADAVWNAAQYKLSELMQMPEYKRKPSAAVSIFQKNTDFLIPASQRESAWNQKESDQRVVEISTINKQASNAVTARAAAHTGNNGDATKTTVTYVTRGEKFKYSIKQADGHVFTQAEMLAKQLLSAIHNLHDTLETYLVTYLNTYRSQVVVSSSPIGGAWDSANYVFEVAYADRDLFYQKVKGFMRQQYYGGQFDMLSDEWGTQKAEFLIQQGQGNSSNLAWQMLGLNGYNSQEITLGTNQLTTDYIVPVGTIGLLNWIPKQNREGFGDTFLVGGAYRSLPDPLGSGLVFAVHEYASAADNNATYGETQDIDVQVEITTDIAPVKAPMSTSNLTPIFKVACLDS